MAKTSQQSKASKSAKPAKKTKAATDTDDPKKIKVPKFLAARELCRYIPEEWRQDNDRASPAAFMPSRHDEYLSVHSCETETENQIADYYSHLKTEGARPVLISLNPVSAYVEALDAGGVTLQYDTSVANWISVTKQIGFEHIPIKGREEPTPVRKSPSHCGVHFVVGFRLFDQRKFAWRLARTTIKSL